MGSGDKFGKNTLFKSFFYAFSGIYKTVLTERNFRIHMLAAIIVTFLGFYFQIKRIEWIILVISIALVMAMEMVNTAIEAIVDLVSPNYHPLAKVAKDVAAGCVLVTAIASVIVGVLLFYPYFSILHK
jgi:undecaprenol kinase/diacylglycerol kinase (ATP)